jgi:hypothetical protein
METIDKKPVLNKELIKKLEKQEGLLHIKYWKTKRGNAKAMKPTKTVSFTVPEKIKEQVCFTSTRDLDQYLYKIDLRRLELKNLNFNEGYNHRCYVSRLKNKSGKDKQAALESYYAQGKTIVTYVKKCGNQCVKAIDEFSSRTVENIQNLTLLISTTSYVKRKNMSVKNFFMFYQCMVLLSLLFHKDPIVFKQENIGMKASFGNHCANQCETVGVPAGSGGKQFHWANWRRKKK